MRQLRLTMVTLALGTFFTACNKDNYTATPATTSTSTTATASTGNYDNGTGTRAGVNPGPVNTNPATISYGWKWNTAEAYMTNIYVKTVKGGDQAQAQTIALNSRYSILPTPAMLPGPVLTTGTYTRLDVVVSVQNGATGAMTINGVVGPGGSSIPVVIRIEDPMDLVYNALNKVVGANERYNIAVRIDVNALNNTLSEQDAANARIAGGPIEISKRSNVELYNKVMQNIRKIMIIDMVRT